MSLENLVEHIKKKTPHECIYHFTDQSNLDSIYEYGILSTDERLLKKIQPEFRGGNQVSHDADEKRGITDYVFLSAKYPHQLYDTVKYEKRLPQATCLKICPEILFFEGVGFCISVANRTSSKLIPIARAEVCKTLKLTYWNEILVPKRISPYMIRGEI